MAVHRSRPVSGIRRPKGKVYVTFAEAVADVPDGVSVMIGGFGGPGGMPMYLLRALRDHGCKDLTIISNTAGIGVRFAAREGDMRIDPGILVENGQVSHVIASFTISPMAPRPNPLEEGYKAGKVKIEINPQGILAERIRAGGAGIPAFWSSVGIGTVVEEGKEKRVINGAEYILETALKADFSIIRAYKADRMGNLIYKGNTRHFNVPMATAADRTIAEVDEIVESGELDPDRIVTPGIYVDRIVARPKEKKA
ncbi:MAG: CoA transferase subunit A [Dehalococcoidia bacterium]